MPKTMNQYTQQYNAMQQSSSKFDEAAADLTAFLDFSSFDHPVVTAGLDESQTVALPPLDVSSTKGTDSFANAFAYANPSSCAGPLRPVDDSLLDSPLGLELSPSDSIFTTSSISGSPYDFEMSLTDFGDSSPLFSTVGYEGSPALASDLVFPPFGTSAAGTPGMITTAELPSLFAALPLVQAHELRDIKPIIPQAPSLPPQHHLTRQESTESVPFSFDDFVGGQELVAEDTVEPASNVDEQMDAVAEEEEPVAPSSVFSTSTRSSSKRKSIAEIKREAANKVAEKEYKSDKHLGFRNTKKKMVDYDAPTLPKNYLTESATSKKRSGSSKVAASVAKRARMASASPAVGTSSASGSPAPVLPPTSATPLDADQLDEDQLSQIELKRRQNTLAARKSRMRKAETFKALSEEVERMKQLNEALVLENKELREKLSAAGLA